MATVDFDAVDYIDEISTKALRRELVERDKKTVKKPDIEPMGIGEIAFSLDEAAFALRKAEKFNLAYRLDEIRFEYFMPQKEKS